CAEPAIVGEAQVASAPYPDPSQFDPDSTGYDPRSTPDTPRWYQVDIRFVCMYPQPLTLKTLRQDPEFADMELVIRPRLSVQKVIERQFQRIQQCCQSTRASA
ncbi:EVE domain-containing protein, partial [Alcanivorax sp. HI0007]